MALVGDVELAEVEEGDVRCGHHKVQVQFLDHAWNAARKEGVHHGAIHWLMGTT